MSKDPKTALKEMADKGLLPPVTYDARRAGGAEHEPGFVAEATLPDGTSATGVGRSKREAEQHAAGTLLQKIGRR